MNSCFWFGLLSGRLLSSKVAAKYATSTDGCERMLLVHRPRSLARYWVACLAMPHFIGRERNPVCVSVLRERAVASLPPPRSVSTRQFCVFVGAALKMIGWCCFLSMVFPALVTAFTPLESLAGEIVVHDPIVGCVARGDSSFLACHRAALSGGRS